LWKESAPELMGVRLFLDNVQLVQLKKYGGEYKDGIPNGQGTYTSSNGEKYEGEWKDEKPWNGTYYDKDGNIKGKFVNGKEIHQ